jgi:hypothetical protein
MNGLRWLIGILTAAAALGTIVIAVIGGGFRRSFGGSDNSAAIIGGVVIFAALVIASVIWPERRALMHIVALLMLTLCIACVAIARQTMFTAMVGLLYAATWLALYYRTVWQR